MRIRIRLTDSSRQAVEARLHSAYQHGQLRLVRRIHALLAIVAGESVTEVASYCTWVNKPCATTSALSSAKGWTV